MAEPLLSLPVLPAEPVAAAERPPAWHGWTTAQPLEKLSADTATAHQVHAERVATVLAAACPPLPEVARSTTLRWSVKVDRLASVDAFEETDGTGVDELIVDIARDHPERFAARRLAFREA